MRWGGETARTARGRGAAPHLRRARRVPELVAALEEQISRRPPVLLPPEGTSTVLRPCIPWSVLRRPADVAVLGAQRVVHAVLLRADALADGDARGRRPGVGAAGVPVAVAARVRRRRRARVRLALGLLRLGAGGLLAPQVLLLEFLERRAVEERLRPPEREARLLLAALGRNRRPPLVHAERRQPRAEPLVEGGLVVDTHLPTGGDEEVTMRGSADRGS